MHMTGKQDYLGMKYCRLSQKTPIVSDFVS